MSAISDVGVNFKFQGGNEFESAMKSMQSEWKSFSESFNKAPDIQQHMKKITKSVEAMSSRVVTASKLAKAAIATVLTAKGLGAGFNWALGSEAMSKANIQVKPLMSDSDYGAFQDKIIEMRKETNVAKDDAIRAGYEINSAMAGRPMDQQLKTMETMRYWMVMLGKTAQESAQFFKVLWATAGEGLPEAQKKTFSEDYLGKFAAVGKYSSSNPRDVAQGFSTSAELWKSYKLKNDDLLASLAVMSPLLGNRPEMASVAINALLSRSGPSVMKLAESQYQQAYVTGRVQGQSRNWGTFEDLKFKAQQGNLLAKRDLSELEANKGYFGVKKEKELLKKLTEDHDLFGFLRGYGELLDNLKKFNPLGFSEAAKAVGPEHFNALQGWIDSARSGKLPGLSQKISQEKGDDYMQKVKSAQEADLNHAWTLVKQQAEELSAGFRSAFYTPMKMLLDQWHKLLVDLNQGLGGHGALGQLKTNVDAMFKAMLPDFGPGASGKSFTEALADAIRNLKTEDWASAGRQIKSAAGTFVSIMQQLKPVVAGLAGLVKWLSDHGLIAPVVAGGIASKLMPGGAVAKIGAGLAVAGATEFGMNMPNLGMPHLPQFKPFWRPSASSESALAPGNEPHYRPGMGHNHVVAPQSRADDTNQSVTGDFQGELKIGNVVLQVDSEGVATAVVKNAGDILTGYIKGELQKEKDNDRSNANDGWK
ncbi:MAG: hypothetical protein ACLQO6_12690 [Desulfomonilaceae bacterium]